MFNGLYFCDANDGVVCDYVSDGAYFTFIFIDGKCLEWNADFQLIQEVR